MDAMTAQAVQAATTGNVNGPEDEVVEWDAIDWRAHEDNVRRLREAPRDSWRLQPLRGWSDAQSWEVPR